MLTPVNSCDCCVYVPGDVMSTRRFDASVTPCCSFHAHIVEFDPSPAAADAGGEINVICPSVPETTAFAVVAGINGTNSATAHVNAATTRPLFFITPSPPEARRDLDRPYVPTFPQFLGELT